MKYQLIHKNMQIKGEKNMSKICKA